MSVFDLVLTGVALSMDAFAAAICKGLAMKRPNYRHALLIALTFGGFQALMPLLGFSLGSRFIPYIASIDHWIAFALLGVISGKMILESLRGGQEERPAVESLDIKELAMLAIATSIDALAVGLGFAVLGVNIWTAIGTIGCVTFAIVFGGVFVGYAFGTRFQRVAEIAGGVILLLIGFKILLEHLIEG